MRTYRLKILGLAVMVVAGLMALSASSALAVNLNLFTEPGSSGEAGFFLINTVNTPAVNGLLPKETIKANLVTGTTASLLIPAKSAEVNCTGLEIPTGEGFVENEYEEYIAGVMKQGGHAHATLLFSGCTVLQINAAGELVLNEKKEPVELTKCTEELDKATSPAGKHHVTAKVLVLVRKHEGKAYLLFSPLVSTKVQAEELKALTLPFAKLTFGGTCSLPAAVNVTGGVAVEAPAADTNKPLLKIDTFIAAGKTVQELLGAKLQFGASPAFIKGEAEIELTGANAAALWGAM